MLFVAYLILLVYFVLGAIALSVISRRQGRQAARGHRVKYVTYFVIIHVLFLSIAFSQHAFRLLSALIVVGGAVELTMLFRQSGFNRRAFFALSLALFVLVCSAFLHFGRLDQGLILFTFMVLSIFDAFSQISGQLLGRHRVAPLVSPSKTVEGVIGGALVALASSLLLKELAAADGRNTLLLASGIVFCAFNGDLAASKYKRTYDAKDFSALFPGNGGILDRFDSLIAGGAFVALLELLGAL
ncbi:MAG: phosphatidate cytidylyltransferase [Spirochaetaceae bacterium]|nr:MAG: phosphatidate cytidylyltransferase [Spirochaetaceae bacterium]